MSTLCPLEPVIPPEAPTGSLSPPCSFTASAAPSRWSDPGHDTATWDPDSTPRGRLLDDEALQLDTRGVTSQSRPVLDSPRAATPQPEFWRKQTAHKNSIAAKLREAGMWEEASKLETCHTYYTICQCAGCNKVTKFPNRCDLFYCPECQPSLAHERRRQVEWWAAEINQPKHVVVTVRNIPDLTREHVDQVQKWWGALRRRKFCHNWQGGFYSMEITNEGAGWHIHIHALVDARWIDAAQLAITWDNVTNGMGRIVKVRDCRDREYLQEVCKYAVKGSQLAKWPATDVATFVRALQGKRTFGVFGTLYGKRTQFAEWLAIVKAGHRVCECGCAMARYFSEADWLLKELAPATGTASRPPPQPHSEPDLLPREFSWPD